MTERMHLPNSAWICGPELLLHIRLQYFSRIVEPACSFLENSELSSLSLRCHGWYTENSAHSGLALKSVRVKLRVLLLAQLWVEVGVVVVVVLLLQLLASGRRSVALRKTRLHLGWLALGKYFRTILFLSYHKCHRLVLKINSRFWTIGQFVISILVFFGLFGFI